MRSAAPATGTTVLVINGHPEPGKGHYGDALVAAYVAGAQSAGYRVEVLNVAELDIPLLRSREQWEKATPAANVLSAQMCVYRADHILVLYPLWLGGMPALLKAFFEQILRPGFAFSTIDGSQLPEKKLKGKSARIVVTMGMPAFVYRWFYGAHSLKSLRRNILGFCGISPIRTTLIGMVESRNPKGRNKALVTLERLGRRAQ